MTIPEAMKTIESHEFAAVVNVASDFYTFVRVAFAQETVSELEQLLTTAQNQHLILSRVLQLSRWQIDLRYENPWDSALTVYLMLLSFKNWDLARIAAEAVVHAQQCWWAAKVARSLLLEEPVHNDAGVSQYEFQGPSPELPMAACARETGELILFPNFLQGINQPVVYAYHEPIPAVTGPVL